jgi:formylglycine-generating enzyme required for sulfatase activity
MALDLGSGVKLELVLIPAGKFMMGSEKGDDFSPQKPIHEVVISHPFYLSKYEITQEQWEAVAGKNPSSFKGARNPVENISWNDAQDFCKKLSAKSNRTARLPTEAEWEYACRAGSTGDYCFGNDAKQLAEYAWYDSNSDHTTHPVGGKKPNAWGLYDMHGNVWEWCEDYWGSYTAGKVTDPKGTDKGRLHVFRGGALDSHGNGANECRAGYRRFGGPNDRYFSLGIRLVVETVQPTHGAHRVP